MLKLGQLRADGAAGLVSGKRYKSTNRRYSDGLRQRVISVVREHYCDFEPTLAREYLAERHDIQASGRGTYFGKADAGSDAASLQAKQRCPSPPVAGHAPFPELETPTKIDRQQSLNAKLKTRPRQI